MTILADRYQLGENLGAGAMGNVYRAEDTQTGASVAIKQLRTSKFHDDSDLIERFRREGQVLRQLDHPNIVKMLDAFEIDGHHYLVMEYVKGGTLAKLMEEGVSLERALMICLDLCDALTRSHRLDVIHRDIKPANVLIADDGTPRLTDFGVAHIDDMASMTGTDMMLGTLSYISPEILLGQPVTKQSDLWSFGVMLYEMVTGHRPFEAANSMALLNAILRHAPPDPLNARPDLPDALLDLIYRLLEKDPKSRLPSARLLGAELEALIDGTPLSSRVIPPLETERMSTASSGLSHNLPAQTMPFVGRETELAELTRLLADKDIRLITLLGPGGMGKTRLSVETGKAHLRRFEDGVTFVDLAPLHPFDEQLISSLKFLAQNLRRGYSVVGALEMITEVAPEPTASEFQLLLDDVAQGTPLLEAMGSLQKRLNSLHFDRFVDLFALQVKEGGNFANRVDTLINWLRSELFGDAWVDMRLAHSLKELIPLVRRDASPSFILKWMADHTPSPYCLEAQGDLVLLDEGRDEAEVLRQYQSHISMVHFDRLLQALAEDDLDSYAVWLQQEIDANTARNPVEEAVIAATADAVGVQLQDGSGSNKQQLLRALAGKQMLLIMDNFEHILGGRQFVAALLQAAPDVKVLATSRERLMLSGEVVFNLGSMDFPDWETPDDAMQYAAVQLFMQSAKRTHMDFEVTDENLHYLARIVRLVEGIPLGILLAAAWVDVLTLEEIATEMQNNLDFLASDLADLPTRQRSMRAVISYSWNLLTEEERQAFARMSVFRGGCTREAAQEVSQTSIRMLTNLVNKSLLRRDRASGRFEIHELLRQYGEEALAAEETVAEYQAKHAQYYTELVERVEPHLFGGSEQLTWLRRLREESDNLRAAMDWAFNKGDRQIGYRLVGALAFFWFREDMHQEMGQWVERALAQGAEAIPESLRGGVLFSQGVYLSAVHRNEDAIAVTVESARLSKAHDQSLRAAYGEMYVANLLMMEDGKAQEALVLVQGAKDRLAKMGNKAGVAQALNIIGNIMTHLGDYKGAAEIYEETLQIAIEIGDELREVMQYGNLAATYAEFDHLDEAESYARQFAEKLQKGHFNFFIIQALSLWATIKLQRGEYAEGAQLQGMLYRAMADLNIKSQPQTQPAIEKTRSALQGALGEATYTEHYDKGYAMGVDEALAAVLQLS